VPSPGSLGFDAKGKRIAAPAAEAKEVAALEAACSTPAAKKESGSNDFRRSVQIYVSLMLVIAGVNGYLIANAPPRPGGGQCDNVGFGLLVGAPSKEKIVSLWKCATAYQEANWWWVFFMFESLYLSFKAFAIPVGFALCVLSGAIFPLPVAQALTGFGESIGSTLCYLLASVIAKPLLERIFPERLRALRERAETEKAHWTLFNLFLRLSPVTPNWFINLASPVVGNPISSFFIASLLATQVCVPSPAAAHASTLHVSGISLALPCISPLPRLHLACISRAALDARARPLGPDPPRPRRARLRD
jgi:membrane protein YqaA with SNARE-associated domain